MQSNCTMMLKLNKMGCFNDVDEEKCQRLLEDFASVHAAFPAYIGSLGFFTDSKTIFASPIMNIRMYDLQREIHSIISPRPIRNKSY